MSASMRPTRCPSRESAIARLTATVVLPTPPLPEPTATIFETPGSATGAGMLGAWAMRILLYKDRSFQMCCVHAAKQFENGPKQILQEEVEHHLIAALPLSRRPQGRRPQVR